MKNEMKDTGYIEEDADDENGKRKKEKIMNYLKSKKVNTIIKRIFSVQIFKVTRNSNLSIRRTKLKVKNNFFFLEF
jgi:hypothetical protein